MLRRDGPLWLAVFLDLCGFAMVLVDIQFRAQSLGAVGWQIGLIQASTFIVQVLLSPMWGRLSDRVGRKSVFVACTLLSSLSFLCYAFAPSLWILLLSRVIGGFGAANVVIAQAATTDAYSGADRATALGRLSAALTSGLIVGPVLGGFLAETYSSQVVGFIGAAFSFLGAMAVLAFSKMAPGSFEQTKRSFSFFPLVRKHPALTPLLIAAAVAWFSLAMLEGTFGRLIERTLGLGQQEFGLIFGFESVIGVLVQAVLLGLILKRVKERRALIGALILQGIGLAATPFAPALAWLFVASGIYALGNSLANPTISSLCSQQVPESSQGELFGVIQSARSVGFIFGPILGGIVFDFNPTGPYLIAGAVSVIAAILVMASKQGVGVHVNRESDTSVLNS